MRTFILLTFYSMVSFSQNEKEKMSFTQRLNEKKTKNVEYDFSANRLKGHEKDWVRQTGRVEVNINNINLFLYDVSINQENVSYLNDEQINSKQWKLALDKIEFKNVNQKTTGITLYLEDLVSSLASVRIVEYKQTDTSEMVQARDTTKFNSLFYQKKGAVQKDDLLKRQIKRDIQLAQDKIKSLYSVKRSADRSLQKIDNGFSYYKLLLATLMSDGKSLQDLTAKRDTLTRLMFKNLSFSEIIIDLSAEEANVRQRISNAIDHANTLEALINRIKINAAAIEDKNEREPIQQFLNIDASLKSLTALVTSLNNLQNDVSSGIILALQDNLNTVYNSFNPNNFNVSYRLFDLNDFDKIFLHVSIKPRTSLTVSKPLRSEDFNIVTNTYSGIKFDVSSGLCFNIGLADRTYHYDSLSHNRKDTVRIVENSNKGSSFPFVSTQLNVYWRPFKANFGIGTCVGLSTNLFKVRYYMGICTVLGKEEKIVISGGVAGGEIKTIADEYNTRVFYPKKYLPIEVKTKDYFQLGGFVSITYNLKKTNTKAFGSKFAN